MTTTEAPLLVAAEVATTIEMEAPKSPITTPHLSQLASNSSTPQKETTPRKHVDSKPIPTDSLITIPLSDPADRATMNSDGPDLEYAGSIPSPTEPDESWQDSERQSEEPEERRESDESEMASLAHEIEFNSGSVSSATKSVEERSRSDSTSSNGSVQVDWDSLDQTEAREDADTDSDEVSAQSWMTFICSDISFCVAN
jgi:hypothetical protein